MKKSLKLKKLTVASLNDQEQMGVIAGATVTVSCPENGCPSPTSLCATGKTKCDCVSINDTCDCQRPKQSNMCGSAVCSAWIGCTGTKYPDCNGAGQ